MRRWGAAALVISATIILSGLSSLTARAASIDGAPQIAGLQFDQSSVSVSGLNVATVKVSVRLKDADGVDQVADGGSLLPTPLLAVEDVSTGDRQLVFLDLSSGTIYDGWWQGDVIIGSHYNGELRVAEVEAYDKQANQLDADPASSGFDPRLAVIGTDIPHLSAGQSPLPAMYGNSLTFKGRLTHADTGAAWPGVAITILSPDLDACCSVLKTLTTDSQGYWGITFSSEQIPEFVYAAITYHGSDFFSRNFFMAFNGIEPRIWWRVWAATRSTRIRLGTTTTIYGSVAPATLGTYEYLQRLESGVWKTVATTYAHSSGRFYLTAHPPSRGYQRYRVLVAQNGVFIPTATKTLTIYAY